MFHIHPFLDWRLPVRSVQRQVGPLRAGQSAHQRYGPLAPRLQALRVLQQALRSIHRLCELNVQRSHSRASDRTFVGNSEKSRNFHCRVSAFERAKVAFRLIFFGGVSTFLLYPFYKNVVIVSCILCCFK